MSAALSSGFSLTVSDSQSSERFDAVARFIGADSSGAFGILPNHAPLVALLRYGLARFRDVDGDWRYLALPGGVLHFQGNALTIMTERYFLGTERAQLVQRMEEEMAREDSELRAARATLDDIERTLLRRLGALGTSLEETLAS